MRTSPEFHYGPRTEDEQAFAEKRQRFFTHFLLPYRKHLKLFEDYKLLPRHSMDKDLNPNTGKPYVQGDVLEHCAVEAVAVDTIAEALQMSQEDRDRLVVAALIHDFYKREDIVKAQELKARGAKADNSFDESGKRSVGILQERGYDSEIVNLTQSVGHTSLGRMQDPDVTMLEMIMHYIDDITVNTEIKDLDSRMDYLERNPIYKDLNESGREKFAGKTTFEVQREVGHAIEKRIAPFFGLTEEESVRLPEVIRMAIRKKIEDFK